MERWNRLYFVSFGFRLVYLLFSINSSQLVSTVKILSLLKANIVKHIAVMVVVDVKKIEFVYSRKVLASRMRNNQLCKAVFQMTKSFNRKFALNRLSFILMPNMAKWFRAVWRIFFKAILTRIKFYYNKIKMIFLSIKLTAVWWELENFHPSIHFLNWTDTVRYIPNFLLLYQEKGINNKSRNWINISKPSSKEFWK